LGIIYYYLGKIKYDTDKKNEAVNFFIKADSISFVSNSYDPNKRDGYEIIIDYYKKNGDYKNQLKYVDRLIYSDSIVAINRKNLSKDILKKYDTPLLLQEKESLIKKLNNKNNIYVWIIAVLLSITLFFIFIIRKNKLKIKEYERQAKALIEKSSGLPTPLTLDEKNAEKINTIEKKEDKIVLSNDPKFKILISKIDEFESNNGFLKKNLTLDSLAKEFQTNRDYLSKLINELKNKNFSQYLNELRINYIVEE
jgi:YesN/AraC family two-component response regulator